MKKRSPMMKRRSFYHYWFFSGSILQSATSIIGVVLVLVATWTLGCSSPPQTGSSEPTKKEIRGDADRFINKLEKEERGMKGEQNTKKE